MKLHPLALALVFALSLPSLAALGAPKRHKRRAAAPLAKRLLEKATGPITLALESVDLVESTVVVDVTGVTRAIDARFFTFHDDRDRHFIALESSCVAEPAPTAKDQAAEESDVSKRSGHAARVSAKATEVIRCTLGFPSPYAFAHVRALTARIGQREIYAQSAEVVARFAEAQASIKPASPKAAGASPLLLRMRFPDGGTRDPEDDSEE